MTYSTTQHQQLEPCLARLGTMPEDKPSFVKQVNAVDDIETLRRLLIEKERERASIANDLDVAARLGLVISETNEAIKIKLAQLEQENDLLRQEFTKTHASSNHHNHHNDLTHARDSTTSPPPDDNYTYHHHDNHHHLHHHDHHNDQHYQPHHDFTDAADERIYLTQELDQARRELTKFRREMDGLSAQLNDMASEMVDSRARVSMYAKRIAEVEHKLATTREMNANLQALLERALASQKQSSSNTSHLVRNIQADLTRVVKENDQLRARIADLETQQVESEEQLAVMVAQAKKYAALLEQAQDTIHGLSEPRLSDDDTLSNGGAEGSVSSYWDGGKETEITKGTVFSVEFRQEMQKEIERNLNLRNEIRHRIITHESISSDKKKTQEGLKYLLSERSADGLMSVSTSSSTTSSSNTTTTTKQSHHLQPPSLSFSSYQIQHDDQSTHHHQTHHHQESSTTATSSSSSSSSSSTATATATTAPLPQTTLRPASFLTGFGGFGSDNSLGPTSFITRGTRFAASRGTTDMPSISTRFFQRLATRFDEQYKGENRR
ncbi:hypothetical protein BDB00DRAFT_831112 [Zychaea mexicana]|uniref:uncharacterized protein n=1 Tax=Zychaea mexicana TaxID=64656 RepID=UPI0022FE33E6|nr:uncharacterized protein BDB00DRAFT_831112 [Zychaea mexicana]KAI9491902.1 hypothetical protein BDB00DRAFT_831112 [Zychaea mexicana]